MNILMNIIVLIFEVLYYSMFMYYAKKEGKFWKYILLYILLTIVILFVGNDNVYGYLIFSALNLIGIKYLIKIKTYFYDLLVIFVIFLLSFLIPIPIYFIIGLFINNTFILTFIYQTIKIILIFILKGKIKQYYNIFHKLWDKNNFYIRYIFTIFMFIFVIFSCIYSIYK